VVFEAVQVIAAITTGQHAADRGSATAGCSFRRVRDVRRGEWYDPTAEISGMTE